MCIYLFSDGLGEEDGSLTDQEPSDSRDRVTTPLSPSQAINNNNNTIKQTAEDLSQKGKVYFTFNKCNHYLLLR